LMIHVEYSFCKMRLPATGLTLPWQLVAAQEPGPMYLMGSSCAESGTAFATRNTHKTRRKDQGLEELCIQYAGLILFAYIVWRGAKSTGWSCLFGRVARKGNGVVFTGD
jgi:hypothetical protein